MTLSPTDRTVCRLAADPAGRISIVRPAGSDSPGAPSLTIGS